MPPVRPARLTLLPLAAVALFASAPALPAAGTATAGQEKAAAPAAALKTIAEFTGAMEKRDGFFPLYWDERNGKLYLEVQRPAEEFLYLTGLTAGLGANAVGLDRGQLGDTRLVRFERAGPKVLLVQGNDRYRADNGSADEKKAVEESFARSVLWGFTAAAQEADGRFLLDVTEFALQDAHGVANALAPSGDYRIDPTRSAVHAAMSRAFPRNTEIEVLATFTTKAPKGRLVAGVAPTAESVTLRLRHSLIALPPPGFRQRAADPRAGYFTHDHVDFSAPLGQPLRRQVLARHRLEKKDPAAPNSEPVKPITYYVDRGAPEPIRTALVEGTRWWNQAFEAAGYRDAFRVELLPEGADPMDVRYNVIEWAPRDTRGWSYGQSVVDPRTGEIIKGHVVLDALRARQDYLLAEGLLAPYARGDEPAPELQKMALARIRQLAAHEVGHTLGLRHNFAGSAKARASVMDYPPPVARLTKDGTVDLSAAYAVGIGAWDKFAIRYGYSDLPAGADERAALGAVLREARTAGVPFLTDEDASADGAHADTTRWDDGADAPAHLRQTLAVRRAALKRFGERAVRTGQPLATMEEALLPLYLHHRYALEGAAKWLGGSRYGYALRGDGQPAGARSVPAADQRRALDALLAALNPAELALSPALLAKLSPRPYTHPATPELFPRQTGKVFDPLAPAAVAADLTLAALLPPERTARLVAQHALDPSLPGLGDTLDRVTAAVFSQKTAASGYEREIARGTQRLLTERLMDLAQDAPMAQVRAVATAQLERLRARLTAPLPPPASADEKAHRRLLASEIARFLARPEERKRRPAPPVPPGSPIGDCRMGLR